MAERQEAANEYEECRIDNQIRKVMTDKGHFTFGNAARYSDRCVREKTVYKNKEAEGKVWYK